MESYTYLSQLVIGGWLVENVFRTKGPSSETSAAQRRRVAASAAGARAMHANIGREARH